MTYIQWFFVIAYTMPEIASYLAMTRHAIGYVLTMYGKEKTWYTQCEPCFFLFRSVVEVDQSFFGCKFGCKY